MFRNPPTRRPINKYNGVDESELESELESKLLRSSVIPEQMVNPNLPTEQKAVTKTLIAICAATHSKSNWRSLDDTTLKKLLIPSIERTISSSDRSKYDFHLYLAADHDDDFWLKNKNNVKTPLWLTVHIGFYEVATHKIPFNPMMRAAYTDGAEYMVRINDDSEFITPNWVSKGVNKLASYDPPNVGMVGPNCREGNTKIMTHDMVHRTHLDIFENYYPEVFSAWWIDDWISKVYGPQRSTKIMDWTVKHHVNKHGTRYKVQGHEKHFLEKELKKGKARIKQWLSSNHQQLIPKKTVVSDYFIGRKKQSTPLAKQVISYSLYGLNPRYIDGALENAKLMKNFYPEWTMRVYYDDTVPHNTIEQLRQVDVQLVDMTGSRMNKMSWRFLPAKDSERFCARDIDSRLSKRESAAVKEWIESGKQFHVMRDHPSHSKYAMSGGMWCSTTIPNIETLLTDVNNQAYLQDMNFLNKVIWPMAQKSLLQHDSFSCDKFGGGKPFPTLRIGWEHVGSVYINGKMRQGDVDILKRAKQPCIVVSQNSITQKCVPKPNVPYRSQSNEDKAIIENVYGGKPKCGGTIVEIGALDGILYSNSWYFEHALQWKAVLIEASPKNFKLLQKNRPNAINVHSAMCLGESIDFIGGGAVGGMVDTMSENHKKGWINPKEKPVSVPCQKFKPIFSKHGIHHVDIFILDVEGGEFEVLKTMDWSVTVGVWVVELDKSNLKKNHRVREELRQHGYMPAKWNIRDWCSKGGDCTANEVFVPDKTGTIEDLKVGVAPNPDLPWIKKQNRDLITNKKYIAMCNMSYKTRSKNDLKLPLKPNSVVCAKGDTATLTAFFRLDIQVPFTLVTIEMDDSIPQNIKWLDHKHLKKWYSWNSKHPDVIPIPIGLNEDSQLKPMMQAKPVYPKIKKMLVNFKQDRKERQQLFSQVKDLPYVHVESYSKKWQDPQDMTSHYESISKYKWTLCPRGAGEDTHRLWEALYLGSIPVVLKSPLSVLYEGLPIIQLNNWNELSLKMLEEQSVSLPAARTNAYFDHWKTIILAPTKTVSREMPILDMDKLKKPMHQNIQNRALNDLSFPRFDFNSKVSNAVFTKDLPPRYFSADKYGSGHKDCRFSTSTHPSDEENWGRLNVLLSAWSRFLELNTIQSWVAHGTLLGWHWGKTQMDLDDDIDVEMTKNELLTKLYPLNGTVFEGRFLIDVNPSGVAWHPKQNENAIDAEFIDMIGGYKVDITAFGRRPNPRVEDNEIGASDGWSMKIEDVFPLRQTLLDGHPVLVPNNPIQLLIKEYGKRGINSKTYKTFTFDGAEWKSSSISPRSNRTPAKAYFTNATQFWIPWERRQKFASFPSKQNALKLNSMIAPQLESVDIDNSISKTTTIPQSLHVVEFNIERGTHWKKACQLIRKSGLPDIVLINEADWGMARSNNEHIARRMAYELGMNYAWGVEFLELTPGTKLETERANSAPDCPSERRGSGFKGKTDSLGLHGNAILSKYPLSNVHVVRSPGIEYLYGIKNDLTAQGYEVRLGGRMTLFATIESGLNKFHIGCFHHQMKWDSNFPKAYKLVGKATLDRLQAAIHEIDPSKTENIILGGDGWGTRWCDEIKIPNAHAYVGGDWICGRGYIASHFKRTSAKGISDHDMLSIILTPKQQTPTKQDVWISMSVCLDAAAKKVSQSYYSEAAVWAAKLWKNFQQKVIITVVTKSSQWEDNNIVKRLRENGAVVVHRKPMENFGCITTSQFARMWAFENEAIDNGDIVILTDVDAFPRSNDVLKPLKIKPDAKAWIWQYTYSVHSGYTFPMAMIALCKLDLKNILGQYGPSNALLQSMHYNKLEERKYTEDIWGIDQRIITNALLKNKICSITNPRVWTRVKLEPLAFNDVHSCWHGTEDTRHGSKKSWLHLSQNSNMKEIAKSILNGVK